MYLFYDELNIQACLIEQSNKLNFYIFLKSRLTTIDSIQQVRLVRDSINLINSTTIIRLFDYHRPSNPCCLKRSTI